MPRLLIIQDHLRHGGSESHTVWLSSALKREGVDARVLTFRPGGALAGRLTDAGVRTRALQRLDTGLDWFAPGLSAAVREEGADAMLLMGKVANAYAPLIRSKAPGVRLVGSVRTGFAIPWPVRRALATPDALVCNCAAVAATLPPLGVDAARVTVIPNPPVLPVIPADAATRRTHRADLRATEGEVVLLCVAGFRRHKGQAALIRAFAQALPVAPHLVLWLVGEGAERAGCEALAKGLGVSDRVRFPGHVADPRPLYRAADIAVMASATDAMSNFLVEAQLHGLPIVAWDFAGTRETFVDGGTGLLTPAGDIAALAAAIGELALAPERLRAFSAHAQARAPAVFSERIALAAYRRVFGF